MTDYYSQTINLKFSRYPPCSDTINLSSSHDMDGWSG